MMADRAFENFKQHKQQISPISNVIDGSEKKQATNSRDSFSSFRNDYSNIQFENVEELAQFIKDVDGFQIISNLLKEHIQEKIFESLNSGTKNILELIDVITQIVADNIKDIDTSKELLEDVKDKVNKDVISIDTIKKYILEDSTSATNKKIKNLVNRLQVELQKNFEQCKKVVGDNRVVSDKTKSTRKQKSNKEKTQEKRQPRKSPINKKQNTSFIFDRQRGFINRISRQHHRTQSIGTGKRNEMLVAQIQQAKKRQNRRLYKSMMSGVISNRRQKAFNKLYGIKEDKRSNKQEEAKEDIPKTNVRNQMFTISKRYKLVTIGKPYEQINKKYYIDNRIVVSQKQLRKVFDRFIEQNQRTWIQRQKDKIATFAVNLIMAPYFLMENGAGFVKRGMSIITNPQLLLSKLIKIAIGAFAVGNIINLIGKYLYKPIGNFLKNIVDVVIGVVQSYVVSDKTKDLLFTTIGKNVVETTKLVISKTGNIARGALTYVGVDVDGLIDTTLGTISSLYEVASFLLDNPVFKIGIYAMKILGGASDILFSNLNLYSLYNAVTQTVGGMLGPHGGFIVGFIGLIAITIGKFIYDGIKNIITGIKKKFVKWVRDAFYTDDITRKNLEQTYEGLVTPNVMVVNTQKIAEYANNPNIVSQLDNTEKKQSRAKDIYKTYVAKYNASNNDVDKMFIDSIYRDKLVDDSIGTKLTTNYIASIYYNYKNFGKLGGANVSNEVIRNFFISTAFPSFITNYPEYFPTLTNIITDKDPRELFKWVAPSIFGGIKEGDDEETIERITKRNIVRIRSSLASLSEWFMKYVRERSITSLDAYKSFVTPTVETDLLKNVKDILKSPYMMQYGSVGKSVVLPNVADVPKLSKPNTFIPKTENVKIEKSGTPTQGVPVKVTEPNTFIPKTENVKIEKSGTPTQGVPVKVSEPNTFIPKADESIQTPIISNTNQNTGNSLISNVSQIEPVTLPEKYSPTTNVEAFDEAHGTFVRDMNMKNGTDDSSKDILTSKLASLGSDSYDILVNKSSSLASLITSIGELCKEVMA